MGTLSGKLAVVTGSNSGIGLGVAEELARAGASVVLNSFTDRPEDHQLAADLGARQLFCDAKPDARVGAGDDGGFARKLHEWIPFLRLHKEYPLHMRTPRKPAARNKKNARTKRALSY